MFFIHVIHEVFTDMFTDGRVENLFLNDGANFQLRDRLGNDVLALGSRLGFFRTGRRGL